MKKFKFTTKISDEGISTCLAATYEDAINTFSAMKNLKKEEFLKIYDVKEIS
jgi:hypothetical protein